MIRGLCPFCAASFERGIPTAFITCDACGRTFAAAGPVPAPPPLELEPAEAHEEPPMATEAAPAEGPWGRPLNAPMVPRFVPRFAPRPDRPAPAGFPAASAPPCPRHPGNPAAASCGRCGDFLCSVCVTAVDGLLICVPCFVRKRDRGELVSSRTGFQMPTMSIALGICAMLGSWTICFGVVLGPAAIVTGIMALREIRRRPALPGETAALGGIVTGAIGVAELAAVWLWAVLRR